RRRPLPLPPPERRRFLHDAGIARPEFAAHRRQRPRISRLPYHRRQARFRRPLARRDSHAPLRPGLREILPNERPSDERPDMGHRISVLVFASVLLAACASREPIRGNPDVALPPTSIETLDGGATDLARFLRGRPALVSLWATWCDTCIEEAPALNRLDTEARKSGDAVVV